MTNFDNDYSKRNTPARILAFFAGMSVTFLHKRKKIIRCKKCFFSLKNCFTLVLCETFIPSGEIKKCRRRVTLHKRAHLLKLKIFFVLNRSFKFNSSEMLAWRYFN